MIGIFLRPDVTQVIKMARRKNALHVVAAARLSPYLEFLQARDAGLLVDLFHEVNQTVGSLYEEVYIVLPNGEFDFFDCGDFSEMDATAANLEEAHAAWLADRNIKANAYYTAYPVEYRTNFRHLKTSVGIARDKIDCLLTAAKEADVSLMSIEPAAVAYLRSLGKWREEHWFFEFFSGGANIVTYSPIGGMFRLPLPQLAELRCEDLDTLAESIGDALIQCDAIAQKSFEFTNVDVPVHVLSSMDLTGMEPIQRRLAAAEFPSEMVKTTLPTEDALSFMVPVGTLLQALNQDAFSQGDMPVFLRIASANVLPNDVKLDSRFAHVKKKTLQFSKVLIASLLVSLAVEAGGIFYFSSIQIPAELQGGYDQANASIAQVKKELEVVKQAKNEHQFPLEALTALIALKPAELGFTSLEVGRSGSADAKKWITLNASAADPMTFRDYAARLGENSLFGGVGIHQISSETRSGQKNATIEIGRGKK